MDTALRLLLVEDRHDDALLVEDSLLEAGYRPELRWVGDETGFAAALDEEWDIVLCDYALPQFGALRALELLQGSGRDFPFIVVSGCLGEETAVELLKAGVADCVNKANLRRLGPAVDRALKEAENRRARTRAEDELRRLAFFDDITGLPNRAGFRSQLQARLATSAACAVLLLDFSGLRAIRDTLGETAEDRLLGAIASRLQRGLPAGSLLGRVGCGEFGVALATAGDWRADAARVVALLREPFRIERQDHYLVPVTGVSRAPEDGRDAASLLRHARAAAHRARRLGSSLERYSAELEQHERERLLITNRLHEALAGGAFEVHYQPKVDLHSGTVCALEALLRWNDPELGAVSPARFIPVAEESGEIVAIGEWVLRAVCRQLAQWAQRGLAPLRVAVNVSARQLRDPGFVDVVAAALRDFRVPASALELEVTESAIMADTGLAVAILSELRAMGIVIAVDDFGTGYSSLAYLKRLPIASLKIDRSFVSDLPHDTDGCAIADAIVGLAHGLGLSVVAEGVETTGQRDYLIALGCEQGQGYLFGKPLAAASVETLLRPAPPTPEWGVSGHRLAFLGAL